MDKNKGADAAGWQHFANLVGVANLVPVAPCGTPSDKSKISPSQIGKIPSRYKSDGKIIGFKDWANYHGRDVEAWAGGEYSIGVITGRDGWYAIDVDLPDATQQYIVYNLISETMRVGYPFFRGRENSNRRLYLVRIYETFPALTKRVLSLSPVDGKECAVEFLGAGQQFVALGTHPSGSRYEWIMNELLGPELPTKEGIPGLTLNQFEALWATIKANLPVVNATVAGERKARVLSGDAHATDDVAQWLDANGFTLSVGAQGERHIKSPREHLYTDGVAGETSVTYFPAGTGGFDQGHFKSMHATDAKLTDGDWLDEFGLRACDFDIIEDAPEDAPLPAFKRDKKGNVEITAPNLLMALRDPRVCGYKVTFDEFRQTVFCGPEPLRDEHYMIIAERLEGEFRFKPLTTKRLAEALRLVAWENRYDSLKQWASALVWDGKPRIGEFFSSLWGIADTPYTTAVGRYMWTALAGRALCPGLQADMAPLLVSAQGKRKSRSIQAIAPFAEWFTEMDFDTSKIERVRMMQGRCVIELGEMQGMRRREIGEVRAFMSAVGDTNRGMYKDNYNELPRRCIFIATVNDDEPLTDTAGNRRWLPMRIPDDVDPVGIVERIVADREQLWAEGAHVFLNEGLQWQDAERLARNILPDFEAQDDSLNAKVIDWLNSVNELDGARNCDIPVISAGEVIAAIYGTLPAGRERGVQMQVGALLKRAGYCKERLYKNGIRTWVWRKPA